MMALAFLFEEPRNELDLATPWDMDLYQEDCDMLNRCFYKCNIFTEMLKDVGIEMPKNIETSC